MFEIDTTILTSLNLRPQLKVTDGTAQNNVECLRLKQIMIGDYGLSKIKINFCCLAEILLNYFLMNMEYVDIVTGEFLSSI